MRKFSLITFNIPATLNIPAENFLEEFKRLSEENRQMQIEYASKKQEWLQNYNLIMEDRVKLWSDNTKLKGMIDKIGNLLPKLHTNDKDELDACIRQIEDTINGVADDEF